MIFCVHFRVFVQHKVVTSCLFQISHIFVSVWDSVQGVEICTDDPGRELRSVRPASCAKTVAAVAPYLVKSTAPRSIPRDQRDENEEDEKNEGY